MSGLYPESGKYRSHSRNTQSRSILILFCDMENGLEEKIDILKSDSDGQFKKKNYVNMCLILNGYRDRDVRICRPNFVRGLSMKSKVFERIVDTRDELLARVSGAAVRTSEREDQPRRTTRDLYTRVAKFTDVDGGDFLTYTANTKKTFHFHVTDANQTSK